MPALTTYSEPTVAEAPETERPAARLFEPTGPTLEDAIVGCWDDLVTEGSADCPVCGGTMRPAGGCTACGADLA